MNNTNDPAHLTQSDCDRLRELIPAYTIGATDPDETALVEALLPNCPEISVEIAEYASMSRAFLYTMSLEQPPASLHDKLLTRIRQNGQADHAASDNIADAPDSVMPNMPTTSVGANLVSTTPNLRVLPAPQAPRRTTRNRRMIAIAAVAAALLVATNAFWLSQVSSLRRENDLLNSVFTQRTSLTGDESVNATIAWGEQGQALLVADFLPPQSADRAYQAWIIVENMPVSAGLFRVDADGHGTLLFSADQPLDNVTFAITDEPAQGSDQPTSAPIAAAQL